MWTILLGRRSLPQSFPSTQSDSLTSPVEPVALPAWQRYMAQAGFLQTNSPWPVSESGDADQFYTNPKYNKLFADVLQYSNPTGLDDQGLSKTKDYLDNWLSIHDAVPAYLSWNHTTGHFQTFPLPVHLWGWQPPQFRIFGEKKVGLQDVATVAEALVKGNASLAEVMLYAPALAAHFEIKGKRNGTHCNFL